MTDQTVSGERGAFTKTAQHSYTLPSRYYLDQDIYDQEHQKIFLRSWLYVGHVSDLPAIGSFITDDVAGQPIVIIRGSDNNVRAFFNVCQHRGDLLLSGKGQVKSKIVCKYHAWCYGLEGELKTARLTGNVPGFDRTDFGLRPVQHALVAGMIFVNFDPNATPEDGDLPQFEKTILDNLPEMPGYVSKHQFDFDIHANWKVVIDNFSEGYHIPVAHPTLATLYNEETVKSQVRDRFRFYQKTAKQGFAGFETKGDEPYLTWFLWPNLCLLSLPGASQLIVLRITPDGPGKSLEHADVYSPAETDAPNLEVVKSLFSEMFNREDIALVQSVQLGLGSLGYDQGRYVADAEDSWFTESGLHLFHQQILDALGS
ncbi:hypothetical protein C1J03_06785 [Sulfitobacter sp. SK012]|uniref:aromatic ring-hydroxylating oxygenase subunit alpha n=1 Tax=Sulfitobacter sp. SK012 TaxID=1389005 RepID=UPI000E0C25EB|nr:aromatic ring-hydroxylating dioxygenase subunit alpha [Sulfitobacter sp. SK012]AXI45764.1 hypothetical protein C1J03_06785 [Sulfitobacter sp. SK012]